MCPWPGNISTYTYDDDDDGIVVVKVTKIYIIVLKAKYYCALKIYFATIKWKTVFWEPNEVKWNAREGMLGRLIANLTQETFPESGKQEIWIPYNGH
jgi:hypothetical protein